MLVNGLWCFVGTPIPASDTNDVGLMEYDLKIWKKGLEFRDMVMTDSIFRPIIQEIQGVTGWKRAPSQPLENWQKQENKEITLTRGKYIPKLKLILIFFSIIGFNERNIGAVKRKFKFLTEKFRGAWEDLQINLKFVLALQNVENFKEIVEEYIIQDKDYFNNLKNNEPWIYGRRIITLYTKEDLENQITAYEIESSNSNFLLKVSKLDNFKINIY